MGASIRIIATLFSLFCVMCATAASTRQAIFVSDLHVGAGKTSTGEWRRIEDFRWQNEFDQFLEFIAKKSGNNTDLILVGDVFELWQSPTMTCSDDPAKPGCLIVDCMEASTDLGCSEEEALARLKYVLVQHPDFVASLRNFASTGSNRAFIVPGNHDAALLFPALTKHLNQQFEKTRVFVATSGYWLSEDRAIYADHGHQFDELNRLQNWPKPFVIASGVERMQKPWGENMVQQFYNQYEYVFPVIDNLADEASGVWLAINDAGFKRTSSAVGKLFRFLLFDQSLKQRSSLLSTDSSSEPPDWSFDAVRRKPVKFFIEAMRGDAQLAASANEARLASEIQFDPSKLTDEEVKQICVLKQVLSADDKSVEPCPTIDGKLSRIAIGIVSSPEGEMVKYLQTVFERLSSEATGGQNKYPSTYVFGHTHSAVDTTKLSLGDMTTGPVSVEYINTGAFQRIVSKKQLESLLAVQVGAKPRSMSTLTPNDLPACYTFVSVDPYQSKPKSQLMRWVPDGSPEKYVARRGACW